jgi:hypothetical protein
VKKGTSWPEDVSFKGGEVMAYTVEVRTGVLNGHNIVHSRLLTKVKS